MSLPNFLHLSKLLNTRVRISVSSWSFPLFGSILGIVAAYLLVSREWQLAFGLIFILPAAILTIRYPLFSVLVWLLLTPFLLATTTAAERQVYWMIHRALPPATVGILILSYLIRIRKLPRLGLAEFAMMGYLGLSLFSIAYLSHRPLETTYLFYDRVFSPMCLYLIVRLSMPGEKDLNRLVPVIFFLGLSQALIGTFSWFMPQLLPQEWLTMPGQRTTGSLHSYSVYTTTLVFSSLYLLNWALNHKSSLVRTVFIFFFFLSIICVFISYSRGSWLAGIIVLFGLAYHYRKIILKKIFAVAVMAAILFIGIIFIGKFQFAYERLNDRNAALSRLPVALAAFRMFEAKPFFGWGYENFDGYDRQFQGRVWDLVNAKQDSTSHNMYLTLLAEQGIIGITLYLAPVGYWLFQTIKLKEAMYVQNFRRWNLLILLWLNILFHIIVNNFSDMWVVFGLGMWWLSLGLIGNLIYQSTASDQ
jgi:O-antigen ligase